MLFHIVYIETDDHQCVYDNDVLIHQTEQISNHNHANCIDKAFHLYEYEGELSDEMISSMF